MTLLQDIPQDIPAEYAPDQFEALVPDSLEACDLVAAGRIAASTVARHDKTRVPTRLTPEAELTIQIHDQGCGIPAGDREKIFDEFFSTKPLGEGTGLGLPITRDVIIDFFGSTINVTSVPGQGSTFTLQLPP